MSKNLLFAIFALMFVTTISSAQKNVMLTISHKLGASNFAFNTTAQNDLGQNFRITRVSYYISGIKIIHDGGMEMDVPNKYILVKGNIGLSTSLGTFNVTNVEGIKFSIGVDAAKNNADPALQPAGSALAFQSPSMHWGWSAGYRFLALEGKAGANFATVFQMHGLNNSNYFEQMVMAAGIDSGTNDTYINLDADYLQAVKGIDVAAGAVDHGVDATDLIALQNFRDFVFSPRTSIPTAIEAEKVSLNVSVYPNPASDVLFVGFANDKPEVDMLEISDVLGRTVASQKTFGQFNQLDLTTLNKGVYVLKFYSDSKNIANQKFVVE